MVGASVFMFVSNGRYVDVRASASYPFNWQRPVGQAVICACGPDAWRVVQQNRHVSLWSRGTFVGIGSGQGQWSRCGLLAYCGMERPVERVEHRPV
ncbi:MAG: hypothetical protein M3Y39_18895 [Chloroflexota bacterium]|nr:hypothetical protein [Chloroflexota bacterium]